MFMNGETRSLFPNQYPVTCLLTVFCSLNWDNLIARNRHKTYIVKLPVCYWHYMESPKSSFGQWYQSAIIIITLLVGSLRAVWMATEDSNPSFCRSRGLEDQMMIWQEELNRMWDIRTKYCQVTLSLNQSVSKRLLTSNTVCECACYCLSSYITVSWDNIETTSRTLEEYYYKLFKN